MVTSSSEIITNRKVPKIGKNEWSGDKLNF